MQSGILYQPRSDLPNNQVPEASGFDLLKMKCAIAPFLRSDIGKGLGKVPAVTVKVLSVVLSLAVRVVRRFCQDYGAMLSRSFAVSPGIFDANLNDVRIVGRYISFGDGEATLTSLHLDSVIGNAETDGEAKGV